MLWSVENEAYLRLFGVSAVRQECLSEFASDGVHDEMWDESSYTARRMGA